MESQQPSVGRIVHFVNGDQHVPAIITDPAFTIEHPGGDTGITQALTVFPVHGSPFTTTAEQDADCAPATWHWPERV